MTDFMPRTTERITTVEQTTLGGGAHLSSDASEMAAFEKGRMQGEMEAIRRMEAEGQMKQMAPLQQAAPVVAVPDVVEINRLTWPQKALGWLGQLTITAFTVLTIIWVLERMASLSWNSTDRDVGNAGMFSVFLLTFGLALWCHTQAILNYRLLPLNLSANFNRAHYILMMACAVTGYTVGFAAWMMTWGDRDWSAVHWVYYFSLAWFTLHALYSMVRCCTERRRPVDYETWAEANTRVTASPEQRRDGSIGSAAGRSLYTAAPVNIHHGRNLPAASANVGAQVPIAPANAPRWAELPRTHAEDYFLLPRAKLAVIGYWLMGTSFLLVLTSILFHRAGLNTINQVGADGQIVQGGEYLQQSDDGLDRDLINAISLLLIGSLAFVSYAAMPPRTTLVKPASNIDASRRASISHNAETRLGAGHMV